VISIGGKHGACRLPPWQPGTLCERKPIAQGLGIGFKRSERTCRAANEPDIEEKPKRFGEYATGRVDQRGKSAAEAPLTVRGSAAQMLP